MNKIERVGGFLNHQYYEVRLSYHKCKCGGFSCLTALLEYFDLNNATCIAQLALHTHTLNKHSNRTFINGWIEYTLIAYTLNKHSNRTFINSLNTVNMPTKQTSYIPVGWLQLIFTVNSPGLVKWPTTFSWKVTSRFWGGVTAYPTCTWHSRNAFSSSSTAWTITHLQHRIF